MVWTQPRPELPASAPAINLVWSWINPLAWDGKPGEANNSALLLQRGQRGLWDLILSARFGSGAGCGSSNGADGAA